MCSTVIECSVKQCVAGGSPKEMSSNDLVENCKEIRVHHNTRNLRIIGNNNRIMIADNIADVLIVGNGNRLRITTNSGPITYVGNGGRIYLSNESLLKSVHYSGCDGILKVIDAKSFPAWEKRKTICTKDKCHQEEDHGGGGGGGGASPIIKK